ncbi:ribonuclease E activity regulator RraA [Frigidibacter sp. ROC022]|uniref:ribonuclease E activity regulator RraA n=1 Tax=Frigidibacter sp. ROC022 TaxID=2971796 RepID=UPI00215A2A36|nr:ribonuclease E activity regulator RraA [Frigidibacter sp. ROC022]MCR8725494.1 ribonuclease E activity regulator RraA [Frigidibacter sp. ROC022]
MTDTAICTADLYDVHHERVQVCDLQFRCFGQIESFYGPCQTVATFEDHRPVLRALETEGRGRVLVVDGRGSLRVGLMGDRLAAIGVQNGWRGVIINGAIRDSAGIDPLALGVRALGTTARRSDTPFEASEGEPVSFGGATFSAGDWVYADRDCVIVSAEALSLTETPPE